MLLHRGNIIVISLAFHLVDVVSSLISFAARHEDWLYTDLNCSMECTFNLGFFILKVLAVTMDLGVVLATYLLFKGFKENDTKKLRIFLTVMPLGVLLSRVMLITAIFGFLDWRRLHEKKMDDPVGRFPFYYHVTLPLVTIYAVYEWCVVNSIRKAIEKVKLKFFEHVAKEDYTLKEEVSEAFSSSDVHYDTNDCLGKGQFGKVFKGILSSGGTTKTVAIKELCTQTDTEYSKVMSAEIKIMMQAGNHKHVVQFIGKCSNRGENDIVLLLEFCNRGSLHSFLIAHRYYFINLATRGEHEMPYYKNISEPNCSWDDLLRISMEIASGMQYLATKDIIHGDLAARNVLLDEYYTAKISDFGLSKHLYQYMSYVKCVDYKQKPLPWRWMSIEALEDMKFSEKSDVWAYGVTIWEIYTLGETPFGNKKWDASLVQNMQSGRLKLYKPSYAPENLWRIIEKCFILSENNRPSFSELQILTMLDPIA